jgi:hypothetical protein
VRCGKVGFKGYQPQGVRSAGCPGTLDKTGGRAGVPETAVHAERTARGHSVARPALRGASRPERRSAHRKGLHHSWPGNIRELQDILHRAAMVSHRGSLELPELEVPLKAHELTRSRGRKALVGTRRHARSFPRRRFRRQASRIAWGAVNELLAFAAHVPRNHASILVRHDGRVPIDRQPSLQRAVKNPRRG